jgi:carboxymethylenebutenolidase
VPEARITIETPDGPMPAVQGAPSGDARGAVLVVQEAFGLTSHIESIARRLADAGWHALAPALFHRQGSPVLDYEDFAATRPVMGQLSAQGIEDDLAAGFDHLEQAGFAPARTAVVGFCMGGGISFYAATTRELGAAVTFYGGGVLEGRFGLPSLVELAPTLRTPWLGLYGDADRGISPEQVEQLRRAAADAPVPTKIVRYPDAQHGFNNDDRPAAYNPTAAADAWRRMLAWFNEHL